MRDRVGIGEELVSRAWASARAVPNFDRSDWRQDQCGAWIRRDQYDHPASDFGWRILDVAAGHKNEPDTLRAFHVRNTFDVAQRRPLCRVHADRQFVAAGNIVDDPRNVELPD